MTIYKAYKQNAAILCLLCLSVLISLPFYYYQFNIALNTNHAWLFVVIERLWEGGKYGIDFYEPNPPMSLLIYVPQYMMYLWGGIPWEYVPASFATLYILISCTCFAYHLWAHPLITPILNRIFLLISFYLAGFLVPGGIYFSERDHFVFLTLVVCLYCQIAISQGHDFHPLWARASFFLAGLLLLIKPHYGIFPALIFLKRIHDDKSLIPLLRSADFQGLSASFVFYLAIIILMFPEYIDHMLTDFLGIYITTGSKIFLNPSLTYILISFCLVLVGLFLPLPKEDKNTIICLALAVLISSLLYTMQGKYFTYHLIPALGFFCMLITFFAWSIISNMITHKNFQIIGAYCFFIPCLIIHIQSNPFPFNFPTHRQYRQLPLVQEATHCHKESCPFFVYSINMEMIFQAVVYSGQPYGSRYPGLWWIYYTLKNPEDIKTREKHLTYLLEDFKRYAPDKLIIAQSIDINDIKNFSLLSYIDKHSPQLSTFIAENYTFDHVLFDNQRYYFKETTLDFDLFIDYDVYIKKETQPSP